MPSPSTVGRKLFAPYFDTSNPTAIGKGLELWSGMSAGQQRHVIGHLLYFTLLELGRLNRTGDELLEAVNTSVDQLEGALSAGSGTDDEGPPDNVVKLPAHLADRAPAQADGEDGDDDGDGDGDNDEQGANDDDMDVDGDAS